MAGRFSVQTIFKGVDQITGVVAKIQTRVSTMTRSITKQVDEMNKHVTAMSGSLKAVATAGVAASVVLGGGFIALASTGMEFEQTLANIRAVAKPTNAELQQISEMALKVGSDFGFSGSSVAVAMESMAKQGLSVQEVIAGIGGVAAAASADGSTLEETMGGLLATMAGLGKGAGDLQHIADVMAKAGDATAASIGTLSQSMAVFGPTARAMGISVESAVGQLAILQDAGIDASSAGTTLSAVYSKLASPTKQTADQLAKLGLKVEDAFGNMKPPEQLMSEIFKATSSIKGNVGQAAAVTELVGLNSQKALLNIAAAVGSGKFDKVMGSLTQGVDGYAMAVAKIKQDSAAGDVAKLTASFEALKISLFGLLSGDLRTKIVQPITEWIAANQGLIASGLKDFILWFKGALPEIVTWLLRIGKVVTVFYAFAAAVKIVNAALAITAAIAAANPITLIIYAIIAAIALLWAFWPEVSAFFKNLWKGITELASAVGAAITSFFVGLWATIKPYVMGVVQFVVGALTLISQPGILLFKALWVVAQWVGQKIMEFFGFLAPYFAAIWEGIKGTFSIAWEGIVAIASAYHQAVMAVFSPLAEFFVGLWDTVASAFSSAMSWVFDKIAWLAEQAGWIVDLIGGIGSDALGGDVDLTDGGAGGAMVAPRSTSTDTSHTSKTEVTVKAAPGAQAKQTGGPRRAPGLKLDPTGAF